jgi:hypothetical protein
MVLVSTALDTGKPPDVESDLEPNVDGAEDVADHDSACQVPPPDTASLRIRGLVVLSDCRENRLAGRDHRLILPP